MKRIVRIGLVLLAMICLASCQAGDKTVSEQTKSKLSVVTTIFPQYDFVRQIAGDKVDLHMLLKPGVESHTYEPTPQDIRTIQNSDLFIYVGGENDVWVESILESMGSEGPDTLKLLDCVDTLAEEQVEGMQMGTEEEAGEEPDEHVWTSPKNAIEIVTKIADVLAEKDLDDAEVFKSNAAAYIDQLDELDAEFRAVTQNSSRRTLVFGDRFPFRYFAEEYGLSYYAAFPGCSSENEASAATVAFLIDKVREEQIPVVFTIEFSNGKIADSICEATSAQKLTFYSCHNLTVEQLRAGETYISVMKMNVDSLRMALK